MKISNIFRQLSVVISLYTLFLLLLTSSLTVEACYKKIYDSSKITHFSRLPKEHEINALLNANDPLDINLFLNMIVHVKCDNDSLIRQRNLVELAIAKGANANELSYLSELPTIEIANLLINAKKPLDINRFLIFIMAIKCDDDKSLRQREQLISLAIEKGANIDKFSHIKNELASKYTFVSQEQQLLESNLSQLILKYFPSQHDIAKRFQEKGYCYGFTTLWLYSKWLQFNQPQKRGGYNIEEYDKNWFYNVITIIT